MLVHDAVGNRAEAVRVYAKLEALLDVELKTTPGPETRRVMEAVAGKTLAAGGE
jgi:DNA-binding SARP family transcriptional activator